MLCIFIHDIIYIHTYLYHNRSESEFRIERMGPNNIQWWSGSDDEYDEFDDDDDGDD